MKATTTTQTQRTSNQAPSTKRDKGEAVKMKPFAISAVQDTLLRAVATYHFLTVDQLTTLYYSKTSLPYVRDLCKKLTQAGYLQRLFLPRTTQAGGLYAIYTLARDGINYIEAAGISVSHKYRPSDTADHSYLFLAHTLAVNNFLIAAALLPKSEPSITLSEMQHERELKRTPVKVTIKAGLNRERKEEIAVIPDGWLDFRVAGWEYPRRCILLEMDRGTTEQKRFRQKISGLVSYANGPYTTQFGATAITISIATTDGEKRAEEMKCWIEAELTAIGEKKEADLFRIAPMTTPVDPKALFLAPIWRRPFEREYIPLLSEDM